MTAIVGNTCTFHLHETLRPSVDLQCIDPKQVVGLEISVSHKKINEFI